MTELEKQKRIIDIKGALSQKLTEVPELVQSSMHSQDFELDDVIDSAYSCKLLFFVGHTIQYEDAAKQVSAILRTFPISEVKHHTWKIRDHNCQQKVSYIITYATNYMLSHPFTIEYTSFNHKIVINLGDNFVSKLNECLSLRDVVGLKVTGSLSAATVFLPATDSAYEKFKEVLEAI